MTLHFPVLVPGLFRAVALAGLSMGAVDSWAEPAVPPYNVLTLGASATIEVPKDWLTVVFSTTREGPDAAVVQLQLRQALDTALTEARKLARPGAVEVQTGAFSLYPRVSNPGARVPAGQTGVLGWLGSTELIVEGRDMQAIAQLTGRLQTLTLARVTSSLSREARQRVEGDATAQAIDNFRSKADAMARQFGFGGWAVREVAVQADTSQPAPLLSVRAMSAARATQDEALPVEAGKATVTANVSGSVQLK